ncbi:MAG: VWA domain-containing protein, partial [Acidobacteria bacterium]|nr:VWA domain-containing protein [Acidobacteriota bacterium]
EKKGILSDLDLVILFDVSKSMNVQDIKPSRLERGRMEIRSLIEKLEGARIGLVAFSSLPIILCPLTEDKGALNILFDIADTSLIPALGTDIGKGIEEALRLFPYEEERSKVLLVVSDGEDMGQSAFKAAGAAQTLSVRIFSLGIGTEKGGVVINKDGKAVIDPDTGREAVSSLDLRKLQHIANATDGRFFEISKESHNINPLLEELMRIKKREYATKEREKREEKFAIFGTIAFLAFLGYIFLPFKRREID